MEAKTHAAMDDMRAQMKDEYKPQWRELYRNQRREERQVRDVATHPFERAVFLFRNRARLGDRGKPLGLRQMVPYILSGKKLRSRVEQIHLRERRALARDEKTRTKQYADGLWGVHRAAFHALRERQATERAAEKSHQNLERKDITFARAKSELMRDAEQPSPDIPKAPKGPWPRSRTVPNSKPETSPAASGPSAPPRPKSDARNVLTGGQQQVTRGVPGAPTKPTPTPQVSRPLPQPPVSRMSKSFEDAVKPGTPQVKEEFTKAADPDVQKKAQAEKDRREQMQKDLEKLRRKRPRDDFERER